TFGDEWTAIEQHGIGYIADAQKDPDSMDDMERQAYGLEDEADAEDSSEPADQENQRSWDEAWYDYLSLQLAALRISISSFNSVLAARIAEIEQIANSFVKTFDDLLTIQLEYKEPLQHPTPDSYDSWIKAPQLTLSALYSGYQLAHPGAVLNEGRLSAI